MQDQAQSVSTPAQATYSLWQLVRYMLGLGTWGFGGPVALVGYVYRDLVERRQWFSEADYKEGMALSQLMPGPLAAQLAIYLGFVHYGVLGATVVGVAFVLPSFFMLQPVLKAMRGGGINIVAIHHHMTHEKPRYIFLHYWGKGPALELTKTVRAALDAQAAIK